MNRAAATKLRGAAKLLGAVMLLGAMTAGCGGATAPPRPNLLLVTIDTVRADRLGAYGHAGATTPAIDRLAREGVLFAHAVAPAPTTLPSHASIFTGLTPPRHGVRDNAAGGLPEAASTMAESFQSAGYETAAFVGAYVLDRGRGLAQGFDVYAGVPLPPGASPTNLEEAELRGDRVVETALDWIERRGDRPWFAWVHLFDAHAPYAAPEPYGSRWPNSPYDGEIAWLDSLIGRLRVAMEASGDWPATHVVLTSDHGESLGEHGEPTHGYFVYDATIRVPLIVRPADGFERAGAGVLSRDHVVSVPVGLIDILPTVAELHGLDLAALPEGRSLAPALRGESLDTVPIYSETLYPRLQFGWHELRALTDGRDKLIAAPQVELYDLVDDPGETDNMAAASPARLEELRAALAPWIEVDRERDAAGALSTDPERLAALRALGYVAVARAPAAAADLPDPKDKIETFNRITTAMGLWRTGNSNDALAMIDALIVVEPSFAGASHFRGLILSGARRYEEAATAFESALALDPQHQIAARSLARTYLDLERVDDAVALLRGLLESAPDDVELRWELGRLVLAQGRTGDAATIFNEGLQRDPRAARMHYGLGSTSLQGGDAAAAVTSFERAAALEPGLPDVHFQLGLALERVDRTDDALAAYARQAEQSPGHFRAHFNRAIILSRLQRPSELIEALEAALEARPDAPEAMLFLAQALFESGDDTQLERAGRLAENGLELAPSPQIRALGHGTLAAIYSAQGRDQDARAQRAAAARLGGGNR